MQQEVDRLVGEQPPFDAGVEEQIPDPNAVQQRRSDADEAVTDLNELGVGNNAALGRFVGQHMAGGGVIGAGEVEQLQQGAEVRDEPVAKPSLGSRVGSWLGAKATSAKKALSGAWGSVSGAAGKAWGSIKGAFSKENRRAAGGVVQSGVSAAATAGKDVGMGLATTGVGGQLGQSASAAETAGTSATVEHPAEFARSFASGGFELAHQVASVVGVFFSGLKAALDLRSLVSSIRVVSSLKASKAKAQALGASKGLIEAVDYAIRQKYEKIIKRAIGAATALAALGVGLAILIANPVGAALAGMIIGGLGLGVLAYKLGRAAWKKWKSTKGGKRREIASRLYNQVLARDVTSLDALSSLKLKHEDLVGAGKTREDGIAKIMRKLKSS